MTSHELGVVVIGRDEGERLVRSLNSLSIDGNVVYVDSGSTDQSVERAKQRGVAIVSLDLSRPFTAGRARNEGFATLMKLRPNTQFVQFLDGDCEIVDGWLETAVTFLRNHPKVAVVCGRRRERYPQASVYNRLCDLEWNTPVGEAVSCGGDALMRVESFRSARGFRGDLMAGEEPELCMRLREGSWRIWRLDAEMTLHDAAITRFRQWWRRSVRCGYGYAEVFGLTRRSPLALYKKECVRTLFWGGLLPMAIVVGCPFHPIAIVVAILYPLQIVRIAIGRGVMAAFSWKYATYMTIAKFAEMEGVIRYEWNKLRGKTAQSIGYKKNYD
jgi:glycosyltransferase involved in cell wall biosynthesis